jgi:hypothetical protein
MKKLCGFALAGILIAAAAEAADDDPLVSKVKQFKSENGVAFVSDCRSEGLKYILMFRAGELEGGYAQLEFTRKGPFTSNFGTVKIENGAWRVTDRTGGLASGPGQEDAMNYLMTLPFHILRAKDLDRIYSERSKTRCKF